MKTIARILVTIVLGCAVFLTLFHPTTTGYAQPESREAEASEGRIRLNIRSHISSPVPIILTLVGPETHVVEFRNQAKLDILPGTYRFSYTACYKKKYGGVFTALDSPYILELPHCTDTTYLLDPPAKTSRIYIRNETGSDFRIYFSGTQNYEWLIEPGRLICTLNPANTTGRFTVTAVSITVKCSLPAEPSCGSGIAAAKYQIWISTNGDSNPLRFLTQTRGAAIILQSANWRALLTAKNL